jgi:hypothetical protein
MHRLNLKKSKFQTPGIWQHPLFPCQKQYHCESSKQTEPHLEVVVWTLFLFEPVSNKFCMAAIEKEQMVFNKD